MKSLQTVLAVAGAFLPVSAEAAQFVSAFLSSSVYGFVATSADARFASASDSTLVRRDLAANAALDVVRAGPSGRDVISLTSPGAANFANARRFTLTDGPSAIEFAVADTAAGFSYGQTGLNFGYNFLLDTVETMTIDYSFAKTITPTPSFGIGGDPARVAVRRTGEFAALLEFAVLPERSGRESIRLGPGSYQIGILTILNGGIQGNMPMRSTGTTVFDVELAAAVPEPATWALLIAGFGATGTAMRRSRRVARQASAG